MLEHSVIARTGQTAKAVMAFVGRVAGGAISCLSGHLFDDAPSTAAALVKFGAAAFSLGCCFHARRSIRCPGCGSRWVWDAVSGRAATAWLASLLRSPICPT